MLNPAQNTPQDPHPGNSRTRTLRRLSIALTCLSLIYQISLSGKASAADIPIHTPQPHSIRRSVSLAELGYGNGLVLRGLSGTKDLYFPAPSSVAVKSLHLFLPYRIHGTDALRPEIRLEIAGQTAFSRTLALKQAQGHIDIPIPRSAIHGGFVHVRMTYATPQPQAGCIDPSISDAFLTFSSGGSLLERLDPHKLTSITDVISAMPRAMDISLPAHPENRQLAAALLLMATYPNARPGAVSSAGVSDLWHRGQITLSSLNAAGLRASTAGGFPSIVVGGPTPTAALAHLDRRSLNRVVAAPSRLQKRLPFPALGVDTDPRDFSQQQSWTVSLPANRLPMGTRITGADIDLSVTGDGASKPPILSVMMNGVLLGTVLARTDRPTHLSVDIPGNIPALQNTMKILLTRQVSSRHCRTNPGTRIAQILPTSSVRLGPARPLRAFYQLAPKFRGGVTVVLPNARPATLSGTAHILSGLVDLQTPLKVMLGHVPDHGPVVWVSDQAPPASNPSLRFDTGRVQLDTVKGKVVANDSVLRADTVVQLLTDGTRPILWIRPGKAFGAANAQSDEKILSRGNLAVSDGIQPALVFSSQPGSVLGITYPDRSSLLQALKHYRLWLIAAGWLIVSGGFVFLLRGVWRAGKDRGHNHD